MPRKPTWSELLDLHRPLLLPAAHDALTAKLIQQAGYPAMQIGGFALEASLLGVPDVDLVQSGELTPRVTEIIRAAGVPVLVDASNGGIDIKAAVRTGIGFDSAGASAIFLEDQASPKKCGHMDQKQLLPRRQATARLRTVADHLRPTTFLMARTDAYAGEGVDGVLRRGCDYLDKGGAHGLYIEGVDNRDDLEKLAKEFSGRKLALSLMEGGGKTPWLTPAEADGLGFSMILYPTSLLFRAAAAIRRGLADLKVGTPMPDDDGMSLDEFLDVVEIGRWRAIERRES